MLVKIIVVSYFHAQGRRRGVWINGKLYSDILTGNDSKILSSFNGSILITRSIHLDRGNKWYKYFDLKTTWDVQKYRIVIYGT